MIWTRKIECQQYACFSFTVPSRYPCVANRSCRQLSVHAVSELESTYYSLTRSKWFHVNGMLDVLQAHWWYKWSIYLILSFFITKKSNKIVDLCSSHRVYHDCKFKLEMLWLIGLRWCTYYTTTISTTPLLLVITADWLDRICSSRPSRTDTQNVCTTLQFNAILVK